MIDMFDVVRNKITAPALIAMALDRKIRVTETETNVDKLLKAIVPNARLGTNEAWATFTVEACQGNITGDELTRVLTIALPHRKIGGQHGPYYLSKIRTGKLPCNVTVSGGRAPATPPRSTSAVAMFANMTSEERAILRKLLTDEVTIDNQPNNTED